MLKVFLCLPRFWGVPVKSWYGRHLVLPKMCAGSGGSMWMGSLKNQKGKLEVSGGDDGVP